MLAIMQNNNNINNQDIALIERMFEYFDPLVLSSYKDQPDKYIIKSEDFEGEINTKEDYYLKLQEKGETNKSISIRFGYRKLADGSKALVIWKNDLIELSSSHIPRWIGFYIEKPEFMIDDDTYKKWYSRNIEANVVQSGPLYELAETIKQINIYTNKSVQRSLYQHDLDLSLSFPISENTHKYEDSHEDLYRYLIDGLNKDCVEIITKKQGVNKSFGDKKTFNALLEIFPNLETSKFKDAMDNVSNQRRLASHQVRYSAKNYSAFEQFRSDLIDCNEGLKELLQALKS